MFKKQKIKSTRGQSLLLATFFLFLILSFSLVFIGYVASNDKNNLLVYSASAAYNIAEAGVEKAIFCLNQKTDSNCGGTFGPNYAGESNVALGDGKFSTIVTGSGNTRTIVSTGISRDNFDKKIKTEISTAPTSSDISFTYALQADQGGVTLANNSIIYGSIYTNSNVICYNNSLITGDATVSGTNNKIDGCKINYDAAAHNLNNLDIGRNAYYTALINSTVKGVKYQNSPDPARTELSTFDLPLWETLAQNGGTIEGDYSPADNSSLGPKKINGNLILNNNIHLKITGAIWVTKNIIFNNNCVLALDSSLGDNGTLIIADNISNLATYGKIIINNNVIIQSSSDKAHIVFIATNNSNNSGNPAIILNNNAEGAIFQAPNGMIVLNNNARVTSMSANSITLNNNAEVHYEESDLMNLNFAAGPGGNWQFKKSTWENLSL
jgi:lipopolysaccharide export system protein LptA